MTALDLSRRPRATAVTEGRAAMMDAPTLVSPRLTALREAHQGLTGQALLEQMIRTEFPGRIAVVSSFGAESAVLLHMVAEIDPSTPVIFSTPASSSARRCAIATGCRRSSA